MSTFSKNSSSTSSFSPTCSSKVQTDSFEKVESSSISEFAGKVQFLTFQLTLFTCSISSKLDAFIGAVSIFLILMISPTLLLSSSTLYSITSSILKSYWEYGCTMSEAWWERQEVSGQVLRESSLKMFLPLITNIYISCWGFGIDCYLNIHECMKPTCVL